ncbi:MAG: ABC transporter permease [Clostridia bacterium]|nr:ABC transporter permease [Clostridia bacterium]
MKKGNKPENQAVAVIKRMSSNKAAMIGLAVFLILVIVAIIAPWIAPYDSTMMDFTAMFAKPNAAHWFGCDELGRDILSRLLVGSRYSLVIGLGSVGLSIVFGLILGSLAGFFGGWVDNIIMRFLDIFSSIPGMLMAIVISAVLGSGFFNCILAISVSTMPQYVRILRASIMSIRNMDYLEAASSLYNCSKLRITVKHILPNSLSSLIVTATMGVASSILMAAGLSYVGLGVQPPMPEWGAILSGARSYLRDYPHMVIFPGLILAATSLSLNMLGDGLRDALDPKLKK